MSGVLILLGRILRGVRLVEFAALLLLLAMILGVYLVKAKAGRERAEITAVEQQIGDEQRRVRLLQAEVSHLEEPARMERLSAMIGLAPTMAKHQASPEQLRQIARDAMIPEKAAHRAAAGNTQTGYDGPAVVASTARAGGPQ